MQNNVTDLSQRLLRSLDVNYNVVDMASVIDIISLLEKVTITKELLETTRLGRHVNELRRKTSNDSLSKRAKELVKKWRNMVLADSNGQMKPAEDNVIKAKKRVAAPAIVTDSKRAKLNGGGGGGGGAELDFSDNSNSSFKDIRHNQVTKNETKQQQQQQQQRDNVILINSDSNSSLGYEKLQQQMEQQPKKRGRKKGSKNHKNLIDEAESSFSSKLAVSRGNSKVKTTQELIASLQNKQSVYGNLPAGVGGGGNKTNKEDLSERAAKLTERVSIIDQKLNTNANRYKQRKHQKFGTAGGALSDSGGGSIVLESGSVINDKSLINNNTITHSDDEVIVVDDALDNHQVGDDFDEKQETEAPEDEAAVDTATPTTGSLDTATALGLLPPIDRHTILRLIAEEEQQCVCSLIENKPEDFSVDDEEEEEEEAKPRFEFVEAPECPGKAHLVEKYNLGEVEVDSQRLLQLHRECWEGVNGNACESGEVPYGCAEAPPIDGLYHDVVPNVYSENLRKKFTSETYKKYSISEGSVAPATGAVVNHCDERTADGASDKGGFREWHEVVDAPSYQGENLRILPYVIID